MQAVIANKNSKPLVLGFAEKNGHIKYLGYSDGWLHKENGCDGTLAANGKPGHFDCRKCGTAFKKQSMLASQIETREERAKDLISEVRRDPHHDCSFYVRSQSRPKAYVVYKDSHGNWHCPCEDSQKHSKYHQWHCKHVLACEYWLENEEKSKERALRPSLIASKDTTTAEFELANKLDTEQIVNGDDGVLAYLINGKVAISFCGTMELATRHGISITDIQTRQAYHLAVATAKATNPQTGNTFAGAHSSPKLLSGLHPNPHAKTIAIGLAKRNAVLKVVPEVTIYQFANKHAQKVSTQNKPNERRTGQLSKSHMAQTTDGEWVMITEMGDSPSPKCEFYFEGYCEKHCPVDRKLYQHGLCNLSRNIKPGCKGDTTSAECQRMRERFPYSVGDKVYKVYIHTINTHTWVIASDDNGFPGEVLDDKKFKSIRAATLHAKNQYPEAEVIIMNSI